MTRYLIALVFALSTSLVLARETPTKAPATNPTTQKSQAKNAEKPAKSGPATNPSKKADDHTPTPAEVMARIKARQQQIEKMLKVAHVDVSDEILEKSPEITLFGDQHLITLPGLLKRLHQARDDQSLRGVLLTFDGNSSFNSAQAMEIRNALDEIRKAGKKTFVYADAYETTTYLAACGATDVCLLPGGEIMMTGVAIEPMFLKGLFDKVGVKADFIQIGEFKGADEMFTRVELSPESRGELNKIADSLYDVITTTISRSRNLPKNTIKQMIDDVFLPARQAKERKMVDHLVDQDGLRDLIKDELGGEVNLLSEYAQPQREKLDLTNPLALFQQMLAPKKQETQKPAIALIHAEGVIVDGEDEGNLLGQSGNVGAENIRKAFRVATRDDNVKAIVLRIDSPGGSALASEVMWQAVNQAAQDKLDDKGNVTEAGKPVVISVGSMAASGGYYLASAGDYIFADPSAIVGSIGVVGGKFVLDGLFDKIGISTDSITRGKNADLFSMTKEWNDRQRRLVTNWMKSTYDQFTQRVMENRKDKIKDIDQVARGRIFLAKQAKDLGLIDEIGGLTDAINFAAKDADLKDYEIKMIPGSRSIIDLLSGNSPDEDAARVQLRARLKISADSPLLALPPAARKMLGRQLQFMQIMDKRPVMLVAPVNVSVR